MKKYFFLLTLLGLLAFQAEAQKRYGQTTFSLDTLTNAESLTFTLPSTYGGNKVQEMASWQVRLENISGTHTIHLIVEESIDEDATGDWVVTDTLQASHSSASTNEATFMGHYAIRGRKMRLRIPATGTATTEVEVDAWVRDKVPFMLTDEQ